MDVLVFFSSRRRHTRCALVTRVQTCALPIWGGAGMLVPSSALAKRWSVQTHLEFPNLFLLDHPLIQHKLTLLRRADTPTGLFRELLRSDACRVGKECVRSCRSGWSQYS